MEDCVSAWNRESISANSNQCMTKGLQARTFFQTNSGDEEIPESFGGKLLSQMKKRKSKIIVHISEEKLAESEYDAEKPLTEALC